MDFTRTRGGDCTQEFFVLDFTDAFWQLPLEPTERRFFAAKYRGEYFVFLRLAQGSRGAPLAWARLAALVMRLSQGMLEDAEGRLQCYVDDPISSLAGSRFERDRRIALLIVVWRCLGFPLAFRKGQRGTSVTWIVANLTIVGSSVHATNKDDIVKDVTLMAERSYEAKCYSA